MEPSPAGEIQKRVGANGQALLEYALLGTLLAVAVTAVLLLFGEQIAAALGGLDWWRTDGGGGSGAVGDVRLQIMVETDDGEPLSATRVFLYSGDGKTYLAQYADSDARGNAQFAPAAGSYRLLAVVQEQHFWSERLDFPGQDRVTLTIPVDGFRVRVVDMDGSPLPAVPVYAFTTEELFTGVEGVTDAAGVAVLPLAEGKVQIRADHDGRAHWSSPVAVEADGVTVVATACGTGAFMATYFDNETLSGEPLISRCEAGIDHNWGSGGPAGMADNRFSAVWTGRFRFAAGDYLFYVTGDDGVRLWVDNDLVIDAWRLQSATTYRARLRLDGVHEIRMAFYEHTGDAMAMLRWQTWGETTCPQGQFMAELFDNRYLSGDPLVNECQERIDFDWGGGNVGGMGRDNVSIRWSGDFLFDGGTYDFTAVADDGVSVWVDNELVIDGWVQQPATTYQARVTVEPGVHRVTMTWYEAYGNAVARLAWAPR